jgi:hypothetical protein
MHFYHQGVAIQPSVARSGNVFVARVCILEEDGEVTSLGDLGHFANRRSALEFAAQCGTAFVDDEPMPRATDCYDAPKGQSADQSTTQDLLAGSQVALSTVGSALTASIASVVTSLSREESLE